MPKEFKKIIQLYNIRVLSKFIIDKISGPFKLPNSVKADRVNALRKQYEAYLEEDKKRKERNEFILGKLDKMCSSTNAMQKYESNAINTVDYSVKYDRPAPTSGKSLQNVSYRPASNFSYGVVSRTPNDASILKEIVSKYILIPKRHSNYDVNTIRENINEDLTILGQDEKLKAQGYIDNTDWKSKYGILNQLKQNEKEDLAEHKHTTFSDPKRTFEKIHSQHNYKQELPEKDTLVRKEHDKQTTEKDYYNIQENNMYSDVTNNNSAAFSYKENLEVPVTNLSISDPEGESEVITSPDPLNVSYDYKLPTKQADFPVNPQADIDGYEITFQQDIEKMPDAIQANAAISQATEIGIEYQKRENGALDQILSTSEVNQAVMAVDNKLESAQVSYTDSENNVLDRPVEDNGKDSQELVESINGNEVTPGVNAILLNNDNINLQEYDSAIPNTTIAESEIYVASQPPTGPVQEHVEDLGNAVDVTDIAEFEAEQNDMFYQETPEVAHDQHAAGDAYNAYDQTNENYQQNDQYYYEGQDPNFPVEINEHEETQQPYDQNYAQQYSENHENSYQQQQPFEQQQEYNQDQVYEQPQAYEQTQDQVYEQPEAYEQNQSYGDTEYQGEYQQQPDMYEQYVQQDNEAVENIQQQLDNEEGYTDGASVEPVLPEQEEKVAESQLAQK